MKKLLLIALLIVGCDLLKEEDCGGTAELDYRNVCLFDFK